VPEKFDLVVIGTGPAGEKGAAQAAYFGKRVAVIERAAEPGGAAVHTGTLPSKTLRETALYLSGYRARDLYGVSVNLDDPQASVPRLIARKDEIARLESRRMRDNLARHHVTYIQGHGRFTDPHTVEVDGPDGKRLVEADFVLIATGSKPFRPPAARIDEPDVYDSDEILHLDKLPASLVVLGAGVIGCEYACMFAALGVQVTVVESRPALLPFLDPEMGERLRTAMENLGVKFALGSKWTKVERDAERGLYCELADGRKLFCERLLFAAGRLGNSADLGLDRVGIEPDARGYLKVDENYATALPHVYAVGGRNRFSSSREHVDGAGTRRRLSRLLSRLQVFSAHQSALRHLHDP
jgi:NAD(P) transhydrogenase